MGFSFKTELLEIQAENPTLHVVFIPGNPGVISYYKEFVESLYELLGGTATVTGIGHISHTKKNWERGKLFSFQEQIDHKINFIKQELQDHEVPIVLIGHSIGAHMSLEILRKFHEKVIYFIGLYPFLAINREAKYQTFIKKIADSTILSAGVSFVAASVGLLPSCISRRILKKLMNPCSDTAAEITSTQLFQYHTIRNVLFMARGELIQLEETPDWTFIKENESKIGFLFGIDDHWGPLEMFEEISKQAPGTSLSIEREGHSHSFCCSEGGSAWVAQYVAGLIRNHVTNSD
ncbi:hypothetical protein ACFE04_031192 [Oxalis oulophora]